MVEAAEFTTIAALPEAALALFGQDAFSTLDWYETVVAHGLPAGAAACFHVVRDGGRVLAVLPMLRHRRRLAALTTPYTCRWRPLLAPDADAMAVGRALARFWRGAGLIRLDCMDRSESALFDGLRAAGLAVLPFDHFGNWHSHVAGLDYRSWLAARAGRLRNGISRRSKRLMQARRAEFRLVSGLAGLEEAIADYEKVYAASWKEPEPYPSFNPALMRRAAASGTLRLGILRLDGVPIAAQFWLKHGDWVAMLKVAYDEAHKTLSSGNVLSAFILEHLLDQEHISEFDFGRGDDPYKADWTGARRQMIGAIVADPRSLRGAVEILKKKASSPFLKKATEKLLSR